MEVLGRMSHPLEKRTSGETPRLWEISFPPGDPQPKRRRPRPLLRPVSPHSEPTAGAEPRGSSNYHEGRQSDLVLLLSVEEVARALGIGRSKTYELIATGELEVVHIGRAARVPVAAVEAFVERLRHNRP